MLTSILVLLVFIAGSFSVYSIIAGRNLSDIELRMIRLANEIEQEKAKADLETNAKKILDHTDKRDAKINALIKLLRASKGLGAKPAKVYQLKFPKTERKVS